MKLIHIHTKESKDAEIEELEGDDYAKISNSDQYEFNWKLERKENKVYKIYLLEAPHNILGLISMRDIQSEMRIHINLIELSKNNIGKKKEYGRIAGCLLAFACQQAFQQSYGGFVSLIPKTKLIDHYCTVYGFKRYGMHLAIDYEEALALIQTYK